jgi:hypothetical protein
MKGIVRRKLSMGIQLNDHSFSSKPNSPSHNFRSNLMISPRYFKTLNKNVEANKEDRASLAKNDNKSKKRNVEKPNDREEDDNLKLKKADNLKRILVRRRKNGIRRNPQMSISMRESMNKDPQSNMSQNISHLQLKTPVNLNQDGSPNPPLNPFIPKKTKNIFSFNKDSKDTSIMNMNTSQNYSNNTSLLYSHALNTSKNQNSFIYLKNRIGSTKENALKNESLAHFRTDSFPNTINQSLNPKHHQSFLLSKKIGEPKKRSKSFFEMSNDIMRTSINMSNGMSVNNISSLGLQNLNTSISRNHIEDDSDQLSNFIKSIQEQDENNLSVKTIEEESDFSIEKQISKISKRPPTVEGRIFLSFR